MRRAGRAGADHRQRDGPAERARARSRRSVSNFNTVTRRLGCVDGSRSTRPEWRADLRRVPRQRTRAGLEVATVQKPDGPPPRPRRPLRRPEPRAGHLHVHGPGDGRRQQRQARHRGREQSVISDRQEPGGAGHGPNDPPAGAHSIIGFPERDFISADGYTDAATVDIQIIRERQHRRGRRRHRAAGHHRSRRGEPSRRRLLGRHDALPQAGDVVQHGRQGRGRQHHGDRSDHGGERDRQRPVQTGSGTVVESTARRRAPTAASSPSTRSSSAWSAARPPRSPPTAGARCVPTAPGPTARCSYDSATSTRWTATYTGLSPADVTRALERGVPRHVAGPGPRRGTAEATIFENGDRSPAARARRARPGGPQAKAPEERPAGGHQRVRLRRGRRRRHDEGPAAKTSTVTNNGQQPLSVDRRTSAARTTQLQGHAVARATARPSPQAARAASTVTFDPSVRPA